MVALISIRHSVYASSETSVTNQHDIIVTYTGKQIGHKQVGTKIVEDPTVPVGKIACGGKIASNELMEVPAQIGIIIGGKIVSSDAISGHTPGVPIYNIPSNVNKVIIPAGSLSSVNDSYYVLDNSGKPIVDSLGNHKEEAGDTITCNIAFVGQGGFLGKFSVTKLKEINIGETPSDNFFRYSD